MNCNDNIDTFMREIAECDNVVIVLTKGYLYSFNCMKEVTYLTEQPYWPLKSIILVIDTDIYGWERQKEVINSWEGKKIILLILQNVLWQKNYLILNVYAIN